MGAAVVLAVIIVTIVVAAVGTASVIIASSTSNIRGNFQATTKNVISNSSSNTLLFGFTNSSDGIALSGSKFVVTKGLFSNSQPTMNGSSNTAATVYSLPTLASTTCTCTLQVQALSSPNVPVTLTINLLFNGNSIATASYLFTEGTDTSVRVLALTQVQHGVNQGSYFTVTGTRSSTFSGLLPNIGVQGNVVFS